MEVKSLDMTTPVIGTAFDLYYDPYTLLYESYEEGGFFEQGGEPIYMVVEDIDAKGKKVISGITLKRTDRQVSVNNTIITFHFDILKRESTKLKFDHAIISALQDGKRVDLTNVEWTDPEINLEAQNEEIPLAMIQTQEIISGTSTIETTEKAENLMYVDVFKPEMVAVGLLPIAIGLCYISWRFIKKKYAKKTDTCISEPEKEKFAQGAWTEI